MPLLSRMFRRFVLMVCVAACSGVAFGQNTTITGTVYSPFGAPSAGGSGDPIPNILVYAVPAQLPLFNTLYPQGIAFPGQSCSAQPNLVPATVLGEGLTDAAGNFTFTIAGAVASSVNIVIQAGRWRRQYPNTAITVGGSTSLPTLAMPNGQGPLADLPHIAVVTGSADSIECIFRQIGILDSEVTDTTGTGSINLFEGAIKGDGGAIVKGSTATEAQLLETGATNAIPITNYDLVMFGCQGSAGDTIASGNTGGADDNITAYTSSGGRIFATHFGYVWLEDNNNFKAAATWGGSYSEGDSTLINSNINTSGSFPEGGILAKWLVNIGVSTTYGVVGLGAVRQNTTSVNTAIAQDWVDLPLASAAPASVKATWTGTPSMQFTFNTPIGAAGTPAVTIAYTNNSANFFQGDAADSVTINVTNSSMTATTQGLTLAITLPGGVTATNLVGTNANTNWTCNTSTLICTNSTIAAGTSDPVSLTFSIAPTTQVGSGTLSASLSGGGLSGSGQCGRVLFNDYHVEGSASAGEIYPNECASTATTPQQKFLEFSLYNLSNFVSPSTTDTITIQGQTVLTVTQPPTISYGTATNAPLFNATATDVANGSPVAGTLTYTPALGSILNVNTVCDTVVVGFVPTDSADYLGSSANACVTVTPDATTTTLTGVVSPIFYGQTIALAAVEGATSNGPAAKLDGGTLDFYINGVKACSVPEPAQPACPTSTGAGYDSGSYTVYSTYTGDNNFTTSTSAPSTVVVNAATTATTLVSTVGTIQTGQSVTFTASVADTVANDAAVPVGTVTFMDGSQVLGSAQVTAMAPAAMLTTSNLLVGPHNITACYAAVALPSGLYDFAPSCSGGYLEIVTFPPTTISTVTLLKTSLNPSVVGQSVTFTASVETTGAFPQVPTGNVVFLDGTTQIGSVALDANGNASYSTTTLAAGLHNITASYAGASPVLPSVSTVVAQQVNTPIGSAGTGFLMTFTDTTFTVGAGDSTTIGITLLNLNNFNQTIKMSCSGLPAEATCTFVPDEISSPGGKTQLIVSAAAPHDCNATTPYFTAGYGRFGFPVMALVVMAFFAKRRKMMKVVVLAALLCLIPTISGCSGNCTNLGVKPGTYTFTVTGTSEGSPVVTQSQTMTVTVKI